MSVNSKSGKIITEIEARDYTHSFQSKYPNVTKAYFVGAEKINLILEQENCIGMRIYDGYDSDTKKENRVIVGVDQKGEDMIEGVIIEELVSCPNYCPKSSSLVKR